LIHLKGENKVKRHMLMLGVLTFTVAGLMVAPIQANFVLCPAAGGSCNADDGTTDNADVIMGSPNNDDIEGQGGNDVIFAGPGNDGVDGDNGGAVPGNDLVFGGPGSDDLNGLEGNDTLFPGPDGGPNSLVQYINGNEGNDTTNVLVSDISSCLVILDTPEFGGTSGLDVVNLIGFGPYSVKKPFGQPDFAGTWVHLTDPIAGGDIFIQVSLDDDVGIETINGLLSPNVTILPNDALPLDCEL
jgi:Ca2+-binding RTX toxin-like protein